MHNVKMLTKEIRKRLPELHSQDGKGDEAIAYVKYFCPWNQWTWFGTEFDGKQTFFGLVIGNETELGYFNLQEMENVRGPLGLKIERDLYFKPCKLSEAKKPFKLII